MTTPEQPAKRPTEDLKYQPVPQLDTRPEEKNADDKPAEGVIGTVKQKVEKVERRPAVAHLLRAFERFNERMGNQFGAAITYFSFLSMIPVLMVSFAVAGFVLASHPTLLQDIFNKILQSVSDPTLAKTLSSSINAAVE